MNIEQRERIWSEWYAWHPVLPIDDTVFWLETVYRRETAEGLWQYRSFRPEAERIKAAAAMHIYPGA
ncbi:hypothetical protein B5E41_15540 [Rhizobium esperanzae]|uniref:Uncharacterized protein n=1 Tax=Rhizobium esperanzae TaxID=1967781 RepID=A0A246DX35_9HYPH|nr:hypothetical protein [Rhizobium esperanzae]OWO94088.1 hypothetical protein B5E41_15540 [Rhizobium esperanzae]